MFAGRFNNRSGLDVLKMTRKTATLATNKKNEPAIISMSLFQELKRRNVLRVAAAYVVIAWLILQVGETLAPALHLPATVNSVLVFFLLLGFPTAHPLVIGAPQGGRLCIGHLPQETIARIQ